MHVVWEAEEPYEEVGGSVAVEEAVRFAFSHTPREHVQRLDGVYVYDTDPLGARLGVYLRDHRGCRIELYVQPHVAMVAHVPEEFRLPTLTYHLAHTLFHEVGHHVTLTLNPRKKPSKKRGEVTQTLEKWAEEYVAKRMAKLFPPPQSRDD